MKKRNGFVSNSSSSSFVISIPKGTELNADKLHEEIFGGTESQTFGPEYDSTSPVTSWEIVHDMINQIHNGDGTDHGFVHDLSAVIEPDYYSGDRPDMDKFRFKTTEGKWDYDWKAYDAAYQEARAREQSRHMQKFPNHDFYVVEYGDDNSFGCEVEHGEALRDRPNVLRINRH